MDFYDLWMRMREEVWLPPLQRSLPPQEASDPRAWFEWLVTMREQYANRGPLDCVEVTA